MSNHRHELARRTTPTHGISCDARNNVPNSRCRCESRCLSLALATCDTRMQKSPGSNPQLLKRTRKVMQQGTSQTPLDKFWGNLQFLPRFESIQRVVWTRAVVTVTLNEPPGWTGVSMGNGVRPAHGPAGFGYCFTNPYEMAKCFQPKKSAQIKII